MLLLTLTCLGAYLEVEPVVETGLSQSLSCFRHAQFMYFTVCIMSCYHFCSVLKVFQKEINFCVKD